MTITGSISHNNLSPNTQSHPNSLPPTAQATVDDPILRELVEEDRWREDIGWFKKHHPDMAKSVSSPTPDELRQQRRELGPKPTLPSNHNPYPNVRVNLQTPMADNLSLRHSSQGGSQIRTSRMLGDPNLLGINSSFSQGGARAQSTSISAHPKSTSAESQPNPQSQHSDSVRQLYLSLLPLVLWYWLNLPDPPIRWAHHVSQLAVKRSCHALPSIVAAYLTVLWLVGKIVPHLRPRGCRSYLPSSHIYQLPTRHHHESPQLRSRLPALNVGSESVRGSSTVSIR